MGVLGRLDPVDVVHLGGIAQPGSSDGPRPVGHFENIVTDGLARERERRLWQIIQCNRA